MHFSNYFRPTVRLLTHSNTAINVFVYAGRHPDFKEIFVRYLQVCYCARRNKITNDVDTEGNFDITDIKTVPIAVKQRIILLVKFGSPTIVLFVYSHLRLLEKY